MLNILRATITSFLLVSAFLSSYGQATLPDDIRDNIKLRIDSDLTPGIVIGIIDGKDVKYYSFGVKSLTTKAAVNEHSVFEIGSVSKTFTGIILADMVVRGEVKLDDPLQQYLPKDINAPTYNGTPIKLVNLANHTSALPRLPGNFAPSNPNNPYADYTEKQLYDFLNQCTLTRDIGSKYEYSNYAMGLLGEVLAAKRGVSYEQMMINTITKPLGMKNTVITLTPAMKENLALGYSGGAQVENWDLPSLAGAGGIRSTVEDMIKYVKANMMLSKSDLSTALQLSHKNSREPDAKPLIGLSWHIMTAGDKEIVWHNGGTGGYRSFIGFIKGGTKGVVVLSNSTVSVDDIGTRLLNPTVPLTVFKEYELAKPVPVDAAVLEKYVGEYQLMPGLILTVTRDGNQLKAQLTGQAAYPIYAKNLTEFFYKVVEARLTFNSNSDGTATESVILHQGGQNLTGKKIK